jgi:hypothetical protein
MRMRGWRRVVLAGLVACGVGMGAQAQSCATKTSDAVDVAETIRTMYAAAVADDVAKFNSLVMPGFYMYDNGQRFEGDAIMKLMEQQYAKGFKYVWTVQEPDVHVSCNEAWIAYVNHGSVQRGADAPMPVTWLESAVLERVNGAWKIAFFHSTRAPQAVVATTTAK